MAADAAVTLDALSPLAGRDQIAHRLLSPLARQEYDRAVAAQDLQVMDQTIRTGDERLDVFLPDGASEQGEAQPYGLLVFVSPSDAVRLPSDWRDALARERLIVVSPRLAGNNQNMLGRRVPLALHAHGYATSHYKIDPDRVYIAGFSGGARAAQLIAFAYADVFRGALLFAGSDPFAEGAVAPPPRELMQLVRTRLRIVQSTGMADEVNIAIDSRMRRSMAALCIPEIPHVDQPRLGHGLPRGSGFARALSLLLSPVQPSADQDACETRLEARIGTELDDVERLRNSGETAQARRRLLEIDARYGWLAAPRSGELMRLLSEAAHGG